MSPAVGWLMKETLGSKTRRQEGNTLQVNTIIDFIQIESVLPHSESFASKELPLLFLVPIVAIVINQHLVQSNTCALYTGIENGISVYQHKNTFFLIIPDISTLVVLFHTMNSQILLTLPHVASYNLHRVNIH